MGITSKSITSSKKVTNIIIPFGHCCSYNTIEGLETEATFYLRSRSSICPNGVKQHPSYCTGVAFDNSDWFVETCKGKDTLHDTVDISVSKFDYEWRFRIKPGEELLVRIKKK